MLSAGLALGLYGSTFTSWMVSVTAETVAMVSFDVASRPIATTAWVDASSSSLQGWSLALGDKALLFERKEVVEGKRLEQGKVLSIDWTTIPIRKEETECVRSKHEDGNSKTREAPASGIGGLGTGAYLQQARRGDAALPLLQKQPRTDTIRPLSRPRHPGRIQRLGKRLPHVLRRLKRPCTRCWSEKGANAMLALRSSVMNLSMPDFLYWQSRQAAGA